MTHSSTFSSLLTWQVTVTTLLLFLPRPAASRSAEVNLTCSSARPSTSIIPNFVQVMELVLNQINQRKWGYGSVTTSEPHVYALAQCHSDLSDLDCRLCFSQGRVKLPRCLPANSGRIFLDGCFLRYDNYSFFDENIDSRFDKINCRESTGALTDNSLRTWFSNKVAGLIQNVTDAALKNGSFAAVEANEGAVPAYALAQCWNTLDADKCRQCLDKAGSELLKCAPNIDGSALFTGCYMRYSTQKFFGNSVGTSSNQRSKTRIIVAVVISATALVVLAALGAYIKYRRLSNSKRKKALENLSSHGNRYNLNFKYEVLEKATDYFNESKKLGQGGAGSVYKGILPDGKMVAVKRLVYNTRQWVDQFFNEVNLISGIQHKNLVKLLGCSIEGPESLLVFEFVANRSLDQVLFSGNPEIRLSWQQRFNIILGVAEGLAYLHEHSGVKIIHRDIKASNILLDECLNPKIADFGLARSAPLDISHISTGIAGTLGYMAPEYLVRGQLTEKADTYSFGVLVLEITSGRKNNAFSRGSSSVLQTIWKHYQANTLVQTIDPALRDNFPKDQAESVLRIGLLCTQASASLRPSMDEVVKMLTNIESKIPCPQQPPFLNASVLNPDNSTSGAITEANLTGSSGTYQQTEISEILPLTSSQETWSHQSLTMGSSEPR